MGPHTARGGEAPLAESLRLFRKRYGRLLESVVIALMVVLAAEVTLGVVFRTIGKSLSWYDELASVLLAWLTFYGSALASVKRSHIGCPEVVDLMPWRLRRALGILAQLLVIGFFVLLGWVGAEILPVLHGEALVSLSWIPMSVVQSVIPISSALIVVAEVTHLIDLVIAREPPQRPASSGPALADGLH
ncbi:MAG TPA: TRAP transporter small permease [Burkholderiaceae bacterium]|nr:TRAP transporter small permease [Burkholderiaceae bacterium]